MNKLTDAGLIVASVILSCGIMFAFGKDLIAWTFLIIGGYFFYKYLQANYSDSEEDTEE